MASGQSNIVTCDVDGCFEESIAGSSKCGTHDPTGLKELVHERTRAHQPEFGANLVASRAWSSKPDSLQELKEAVRAIFHCMAGPPRAYFDIPLAERMGEPEPEYPRVEHLYYMSVCWREPAEARGQAAHQRLIDHMWAMFQTARMLVEGKGCALLFWRRELEFEDTLDSVTKEPYVKLSCRLVIPGVDLTPYSVGEGELIPRIPT
jgi:hypothetical protein